MRPSLQRGLKKTLNGVTEVTPFSAKIMPLFTSSGRWPGEFFYLYLREDIFSMTFASSSVNFFSRTVKW